MESTIKQAIVMSLNFQHIENLIALGGLILNWIFDMDLIIIYKLCYYVQDYNECLHKIETKTIK